MFLIVFTLVPRNPKIAFRRSLAPRARNLAMVGTDVIQFTFGGNVSRTTGRILRVGLNANGPVRHIQENTSQRNGIRSGIDHARNILAVPVHDDREVIPLSRRGSPITGPRPRQRMPFLHEGERWHGETYREAKQMENPRPHHRFATISLSPSDRIVSSA